jgi:hypothetical protein
VGPATGKTNRQGFVASDTQAAHIRAVPITRRGNVLLCFRRDLNVSTTSPPVFIGTPHAISSDQELVAGREKGESVFRVEMNQNAHLLLMKIEGQLKGEYAEHTRTVVTCCDPALKVLVDLREVTYVDTAGEEVLSLLARLGAKFVAENTYTRHLCERLRLPLTRAKSH